MADPGIIAGSGGDPVGVLGSWLPHFLAMGAKCARTPTFSVMLLYMACNPTVAELCMHADFCSSILNTNVDFIRRFDCINCIRMFGSGRAGSAHTPRGVHEREGKKGGLTEGERWPQAWTPSPRFMTDHRHWLLGYDPSLFYPSLLSPYLFSPLSSFPFPLLCWVASIPVP